MAWLSENLLSIQAIINHDEFLTEFARTIGDMANVLPKTNFLCELYPTKQMEDGIAHVYSKIIDFVLEAVKWYKKSKLQHALSLYSVTCGDIGTEATTVQKYLDTILYLAKIWDCGQSYCPHLSSSYLITQPCCS